VVAAITWVLEWLLRRRQHQPRFADRNTVSLIWEREFKGATMVTVQAVGSCSISVAQS
jgi:hypothetical protein